VRTTAATAGPAELPPTHYGSTSMEVRYRESDLPHRTADLVKRSGGRPVAAMQTHGIGSRDRLKRRADLLDRVADRPSPDPGIAVRNPGITSAVRGRRFESGRKYMLINN